MSLLFASTENLAVEALFPALRALQQVQPGLQIVVVGPPGAAFEAAGLQVQRHPLMPRAAFLDFARSLPNPVGVVPLEDSRFAASKSAVKWLYYAGIGVPTLCSAVSPYAEVLAHGHNGWLVPNTAAAWESALRAVVADPAARQRVAQTARDEVQQRHGLGLTLAAWRQVIALARQQREDKPPRAPMLGERLQDWGAALAESSLGGLRAFNRARLAQRQRKKQARSKAP